MAMKMPPGMLRFWHEELDDFEDDFMTEEEIESAFVGWWAVVLHRFWMSMDWDLGWAKVRTRGRLN